MHLVNFSLTSGQVPPISEQFRSLPIHPTGFDSKITIAAAVD
jgi:hypothetical protein